MGILDAAVTNGYAGVCAAGVAERNKNGNWRF